MNTISSLFNYIGNWLSGNDTVESGGIVKINGKAGQNVGLKVTHADTNIDAGLRVFSGGDVAGVYCERDGRTLISWNGTQVKVDGLIMQTYNPTVNVTASVGKLNSASIRKYANIVHLFLLVEKTSDTAVGANIFEGTLGSQRPVLSTRGTGFVGSNTVSANVQPNGSVTVRNTGSSKINANTEVGVQFTYLVD